MMMPPTVPGISPSSSSGTLVDFGTRWNETSTEDETRLIKTIDEADGELVALRSVVLEKETALSQKKEELYALRARRAPITRVPDDVLVLIFEANAGDIPLAELFKAKQTKTRAMCTSLAVLHVCRRWRLVASHTAALWSSIVISDRRSLEYASRLVEQHTFQFGARLQLKCSATRTLGPLLMHLIKFLTTNASRLVRLTSDMCAHANDHIFGNRDLDLPQLRKLALVPPNICSDDIALRAIWPASKLSAVVELTLEFGVLPPRMYTVHSALQHLSLTNVFSVEGEEMAHFLPSFPSLRSLHLQNCHSLSVSSPYDYDEDNNDPPLTLEHLNELTLLWSDLPNIAASNLKRLAIAADYTIAACYFVRSFPLLSVLSVRGANLVDAFVKELDPLTTPDPFDDSRPEIFLPNLQELSLHGQLQLWIGHVPSQRANRLTAMLGNRQGAGHPIKVLGTFPLSPYGADALRKHVAQLERIDQESF